MTTSIRSDFVFLVLDGDKIGDELATLYFENNIQGLRQFDQLLRETFTSAASTLRDAGCDLIAAGADGITCSGDEVIIRSIVSKIFDRSELSFSCGLGKDLRTAFTALRYAKAKGRSRIGATDSSGLYYSQLINEEH